MAHVRPQMAPPRSFVVLTLAALAAFGVLIGLGAWQLQRMAEKQAFITSLAREAKGPARTEWARTPDFGRVSVSGRFIAGKTAFVRVTLPDGTASRPDGPGVGGISLGGLGLYVMTPLQRDDGTVILVNRGFVATGADGRAPAVSTPEGHVTITGFRRPPEPRHWFAVADDPARLVFATRDPAVIAPALRVAADPAAFLEAERIGTGMEPGSPQGIEAEELLSRIPDNHLNYALTWFGLAATLVGVYLAMVLAKRRERQGSLP